MLPAPRESAHPGGGVRTQTETRHQVGDPSMALGGGHAVQSAEEVQVLRRQQVGVQRAVLRAQTHPRTRRCPEPGERLAHQPNLARIGLQQLADDVQNGGLAAAIGAEQAHDFTACDLQAEAVQHLAAAEALVEAIDPKRRGHAR